MCECRHEDTLFGGRMYVYVCVYIHKHIYNSTRTRTHTDIHSVYNIYIYIYHTHIYIYIYTIIYIYTHTHTQTDTYIRIHTYIHNAGTRPDKQSFAKWPFFMSAYMAKHLSFQQSVFRQCLDPRIRGYSNLSRVQQSNFRQCLDPTGACKIIEGRKSFHSTVYYWKTVEKQETDPQLFCERQEHSGLFESLRVQQSVIRQCWKIFITCVCVCIYTYIQYIFILHWTWIAKIQNSAFFLSTIHT